MKRQSGHRLLVGSIVIAVLCGGCEDATVPYTPEIIPFTTIPCLDVTGPGETPRNINTQAEYDSLFGAEPCPDSLIDFSKYTLLYQYYSGTGCDDPFIEASITKDDMQRKVTFQIRIIEHGTCLPRWAAFQWALIPKVPAGYTVVFQKETIVDSSAT